MTVDNVLSMVEEDVSATLATWDKYKKKWSINLKNIYLITNIFILFIILIGY